jgi:hypothetical protein
MTKQPPKKQALSDAVKRKAPNISTAEDGKLIVESSHEGDLRELYGVKTDAVANGIMTSALYALGENAKAYMNLMASMCEELEPQDAIEGMLVTQMTATHVTLTLLSARTIDAKTPQLREGYERSMTRLSRTFIAQMDALKKYRAKAQQTVRVERVTVNEGGQAIVGSVTHGGRAEHEK